MSKHKTKDTVMQIVRISLTVFRYGFFFQMLSLYMLAAEYYWYETETIALGVA